ncbi:MAG TPA: nuclear transport factor 2 family protein [Kofleriaceae bacterium]|nr:nuclear transport factor 2 family protein [Kofleriaceae bacterium]
MKATIALIAVAALAASCKKKSEASHPVQNAAPMTADKGSAAPPPPAPKPPTADDMAKRFHDCWTDWAATKWDDFKSCYANDAASEAPGSGMPAMTGSTAIVDAMKQYRAASPDEKAQSQLLLVSGKKIVAVTLVSGKQSGPLKTATGNLAATNKPFGFYLGQVLALDDTGKVTHEADYFDMATMLGQLQPMKDHPVRAASDKLAMPEQVALAHDDAKEKANLVAFQKLVDAFNKHDVKTFGELIADDATWSEQAMAKDETKKELVTNLPQLWKSFSDLKFEVADSWAAGDYVAATETFAGTNDGDLPMMHAKKTGKKVSLPFLAIHKLDGGKVKATWIFFQGGGFASQLGLDKVTKK